MALHEFINMYANVGSVRIAFTVSLILFFAYMILELINLNSNIRDMDILNIETTSRATLVYTYVTGYLRFIFKLTMKLLTLGILISIILWIILTIFELLGGGQSGGKYNSAAELRGGSLGELSAKFKNIAVTVIMHIMGTYFLRNFIFIFLVIIPLFLLFFTMMFSQFYDPKIILAKDGVNAPNITETNHNYMIMVITTLVVFGLLKLLIDYVLLFMKNAAEAAE
jgi:hypothetical protein